MVTPSRPYLTPGEIAKLYGVNISKVLGWIARGELAGLNIAHQAGRRPRWRISPDALERFEASRTSTPPAPPATRRRASSPATKEYV